MNTNVEKFINKRKEFESADKYNVAMKLDYIIAQINNLFDIMDGELSLVEVANNESNKNQPIENLPDNKIEEINIDDLMDDIDPKKGEEILDKLIAEAGVSSEELKDYDKFDNMPVEDIVKEELESYGLKLDYIGCKLIIDLVNIAPELGLTKKSTYEEICKAMSPININYFKRNITFIRKKADFSNAKYLTILSRMEPKNITNEFLLRNFIELAY